MDNCGITGNPTLQVLIKDGGDGLGDVSMYKEKGDRYLEDKAYRYSFCVLKITVDRENERVVIWEEDTPGSVCTNKTLIEAVCDENQTVAMVACVVPVEREREQIANNLISVETGTLWRNFKVEFINSMEDLFVTCAMRHKIQQKVILEHLKPVAPLKRPNKLLIFIVILTNLLSHNFLL